MTNYDDKTANSATSEHQFWSSKEWTEIYKEICANIRNTDEISFRLLGLVPVVSGAAASVLALIEKSNFLRDMATCGVSLVVLSFSVLGFCVTFGLFRWELRNIEKCKWLVRRAEDLEQYALKIGKIKLESIQYLGWPSSSWGKTKSEKVVYGAALSAWLIPAAFAVATVWGRAC